MLGSFLEVALSTEDIGSSWAFYERLGFSTAVAGDIWSHHYGVMTCRGLMLGLHARRQSSPSVVLTRANVLRLHTELEKLGVTTIDARIGNDVFNELSLRDPSGLLLRVLEARTFSPPESVPSTTILGACVGLSLPLREFDVAVQFWARLGITASTADEPWPSVSCSLGPLHLAYHSPKIHQQPMLLFRHKELAIASRRLSDLGLKAEPGLGGFSPPANLCLESPEGLDLVLFA